MSLLVNGLLLAGLISWAQLWDRPRFERSNYQTQHAYRVDLYSYPWLAVLAGLVAAGWGWMDLSGSVNTPAALLGWTKIGIGLLWAGVGTTIALHLHRRNARHHRWQDSAGRNCYSCGYDLYGTAARACPECGAAVCFPDRDA